MCRLGLVAVILELFGDVGRRASRPSPPPIVFGSLFLNMGRGEVLSAGGWEPWLLSAVILQELVFDTEVPTATPHDPKTETGDTSACWNVSFSNGRLWGDALRTTVCSREGRMMAFDILRRPEITADLLFCPSEDVADRSPAFDCPETLKDGVNERVARKPRDGHLRSLLVKDLRAVNTLTLCRRSLVDSVVRWVRVGEQLLLGEGFGVCSSPGEESPV